MQQPAGSIEGQGRPRWSVVLRALREARGVTLDGWATRLGVSRTTVQRWERGERVPDPGAESSLAAFCRESGLFRSFTSGPLAGLTLSAELLQELLAEARWGAGGPAQPAPAPQETMTVAVVPARSADDAPAAMGDPAAAQHTTDGEAIAAPPALRPPPANLPAPITSFIGRGQELADLRRVQAGARLCTLAGPGGSGKTRLALALADELRWAYPQGLWWLDLTALADPALVPEALATLLGVRGGQQPAETLLEKLRDQHSLLIFDNCEHLLPDLAGFVETVLRTCRQIEVMATSRESLGINGEVVWRVPPLSLPAAPADITASDAGRLLLERARLHRPNPLLTAADQRAMVDICRQLDGIPLALELAAARVKVLSFSQIAERLSDRFRLLTGSGRTTLPRHQTLRAAMDWSYELLTAEEQSALRALSVFAGGFTLEAAEEVLRVQTDWDGEELYETLPASGHSFDTTGQVRAVRPTDGCGPASDVTPLDLLERLVDKSLVLAEPLGAVVRYRMLETVRRYAMEKLVAAGEAAAVLDRHSRWCLALVETAWRYRNSDQQLVWLERLDSDHDNLRAALAAHSHGGQVAARAIRIGADLGWFWHVRGHSSEGRRWLSTLLQLPSLGPPATRARMLDGAGLLATDQRDHDEAEQLFEQALALWREVDDEAAIAGTLNNLAIVAGVRHQFDRAQELFEQCLATGRKLNDDDRMIASLINLGIVARQQGVTARAIAHYEDVLPICRRTGDPRRLATVLANLGNALRDEQRSAEAVGHYRESLELYHNVGDPQGIARCFQGLAATALDHGDVVTATRLAAATAAIRAKHGVRPPPDGQERFNYMVEAARAALGDADFNDSWQQGQTLPLDDAIAEAMAVPVEPPSR